MRWVSFLEYITMLALGQDDAVYRNYDLDNWNGSKPGQMLDRAYDRMGFDQYNTSRALIEPDVRARLRSCGFVYPGTPEALQDDIRRWYTWDRIRCEELRRWPLRSIDNPLF